jgi:hypothetical protein
MSNDHPDHPSISDFTESLWQVRFVTRGKHTGKLKDSFLEITAESAHRARIRWPRAASQHGGHLGQFDYKSHDHFEGEPCQTLRQGKWCFALRPARERLFVYHTVPGQRAVRLPDWKRIADCLREELFHDDPHRDHKVHRIIHVLIAAYDLAVVDDEDPPPTGTWGAEADPVPPPPPPMAYDVTAAGD